MIDVCAQIEDLIFYALKLEKAAIAVQRLIEAGDMQSAIRVIQAAADIACERDLASEIQAEAVPTERGLRQGALPSAFPQGRTPRHRGRHSGSPSR